MRSAWRNTTCDNRVRLFRSSRVMWFISIFIWDVGQEHITVEKYEIWPCSLFLRQCMRIHVAEPDTRCNWNELNKSPGSNNFRPMKFSEPKLGSHGKHVSKVESYGSVKPGYVSKFVGEFVALLREKCFQYLILMRDAFIMSETFVKLKKWRGRGPRKLALAELTLLECLISDS